MPGMIDVSGRFGPKGTVREVIALGFKMQLHAVNVQKHEPFGVLKGICVHWSAVDDDSVFDDYHLGVAKDNRAGRSWVIKALPLDAKGMHVAMRNTGIMGAGFCAAGPAAIDDQEIDTMALVLAEVCIDFRPDGKKVVKLHPEKTITLPKLRCHGEHLIPVPGETVTVPTIFDHGMIAALDGYANHRWDVGSQLPKSDARNKYARLMPKLIKYFHELMAGTRKPQFQSLLA